MARLSSLSATRARLCVACACGPGVVPEVVHATTSAHHAAMAVANRSISSAAFGRSR